jgi:hypothetical protein
MLLDGRIVMVACPRRSPLLLFAKQTNLRPTIHELGMAQSTEEMPVTLKGLP